MVFVVASQPEGQIDSKHRANNHLTHHLSLLCVENVGFKPDVIEFSYKAISLTIPDRTMQVACLCVSNTGKHSWWTLQDINLSEVPSTILDPDKTKPIKILLAKQDIVSHKTFNAIPIAGALQLIGDWISQRPIRNYVLEEDDTHRAAHVIFATETVRRPCLERFVESLLAPGVRMDEAGDNEATSLPQCAVRCRSQQLRNEEFSLPFGWRDHPHRGPMITICGPDAPRNLLCDLLKHFMESASVSDQALQEVKTHMVASVHGETVNFIKWMAPDQFAELLVKQTQTDICRLQKIKKIVVKPQASITNSSKRLALVSERDYSTRATVGTIEDAFTFADQQSPEEEAFRAIRPKGKKEPELYVNETGDIEVSEFLEPAEMRGSILSESVSNEWSRQRWWAKAFPPEKQTDKNEIREAILKCHQQLSLTPVQGL